MSVEHLASRRGQPRPPAPPASIDAEQALLGAILVNPDAFAHVVAIVRAEHFAEEVHGRIFTTMGQLLQEGRPITVPGLIAYLGDHEIEPEVRTQRYLAMLAGNSVPTLLVPEHAVIIRDMATRRALIAQGEALIQRASDALVDVPPDAIAADSLDGLRAVLEATPRERSRFALGKGAANFVERIEAIRRGEVSATALMTGFADLDRVLGGLHPGTLVVLGGRPGMGKTVVMSNLAERVARQNAGAGVLEFSLEIPADELLARHLAALAFSPDQPIGFADILRGDLDDAETERLVVAQRTLDRLPIIVECPPRITAAEIVGRIQVEKRAMAARGIKLGVVLIDYLDKISASDRYAGQRTYEIQEIVSALKSAARSEDVCIVLLVQLNRGTEQRSDQRPSLADIKSSSFLEQEAHAILFVYREAYYLLKSEEYRTGHPDAHARMLEVQHRFDLIIGKNRSGPEATVTLWCSIACSHLSSHGRAI